jgi:hypothetical protein
VRRDGLSNGLFSGRGFNRLFSPVVVNCSSRSPLPGCCSCSHTHTYVSTVELSRCFSDCCRHYSVGRAADGGHCRNIYISLASFNNLPRWRIELVRKRGKKFHLLALTIFPTDVSTNNKQCAGVAELVGLCQLALQPVFERGKSVSACFLLLLPLPSCFFQLFLSFQVWATVGFQDLFFLLYNLAQRR